ncbi:MAG: hypothetical protein HXX11_09960 [Desulfuromonadales bacterium]|nr:hypothetical protein [Desulfuromonadales bacterium]
MNNILYFVISAVLGFVSIVIPPYVTPGKSIIYYESPLFPIITTAIKNIYILPTIVLLVIVGFILGYFKTNKWWLWGIATIILFPTSSLLEMTLYPSSHNLWPFEFLIYSILAVPPCIGAFLGYKLRIKKHE